MFASLHRADAELTPENGRARFVLTDHRDAGEMADVRELSIVFALVRILRTQRIATPTPAVFYYLPGLPPNFLVEAAASAGARVKVGEDPRAWLDVTDTGSGRAPRPVEVIFNEAMSGLAVRTAAESGVSLDVDGLHAFEKTQLPREDEDEDEIEIDVDFDGDEEGVDVEKKEADGGEARWTKIVKLASFAGEILRRQVNGRWIVKMDGDQSFPLLFECTSGDKELVVNLLGKGQKFHEQGIEDSLALLASTVIQMIRAGD